MVWCLSFVAFRSEAKDLLGDDWVQRHRRVVQQHANQYKRIAWAKVFLILLCPADSLPQEHGKILCVGLGVQGLREGGDQLKFYFLKKLS